MCKRNTSGGRIYSERRDLCRARVIREHCRERRATGRRNRENTRFVLRGTSERAKRVAIGNAHTRVNAVIKQLLAGLVGPATIEITQVLWRQIIAATIHYHYYLSSTPFIRGNHAVNHELRERKVWIRWQKTFRVNDDLLMFNSTPAGFADIIVTSQIYNMKDNGSGRKGNWKILRTHNTLPVDSHKLHVSSGMRT